MTNITNPREYTITGTWDVAGSIRPDKESKGSKRFTLRFRLNNVPLMDVLTPALAAKKITWANGKGRDGYDKMKAGQVIDLDYTSPATTIKSREEIIEETATMFMKAGVAKKEAYELATKAVDNPEILK